MNTENYGLSSIQNDQIVELDGATLEWEAFTVSHGMLFMKISTEKLNPIKTAILCFGSASYVDCPTIMHEIKIRVAKNIEGILLNLPITFAPSLINESNLFTISCREGVFYILALEAWISWDKKAYLNLIEKIKLEQLWINGPPINRL